jgi:processive 1,2-diacylglycerol beta-glucosyltransferase
MEEFPLNKKVLILSEAVGTGHTKAAEALMQGISLIAPSVEVQMLELGRELHPIATTLVYQLYLKMIARCPAVWRKIYDYKQDRPISEWTQVCIYQIFHRTVKNLLVRFDPDLVVCTHPFSSSSLACLKRAGYPLRLYTVITDFYAHGAWVQPEVDGYLVSGNEVYKQLVSMGIPREKVIVTGLPLTLHFRVKQNKKEMRRLLGMKDMPTIMIMGGGLGLGGIDRLAHALIRWRDDIQIVICTGHNHQVKRMLEKSPEFQHPTIHILGFVDRISQWMDAADWLITKAGGLTCFEALAKKLPLFIYQPLPGHEENNCEFLTKNKLAIRINTEEEISDWMRRLLDCPKDIAFLEQNMERFQQMIDPLATARSVLDLLGMERKLGNER